MNVWFAKRFVPETAEGLLQEYPRVRAWAERVAAIGHGSHAAMSGGEALAVAAAATSQTAEHRDEDDPDGLTPGMNVAISAIDYGKDPISGELVSSSAQRVAIRRSDPAVGEVVVHFPRAGFLVRPASA